MAHKTIYRSVIQVEILTDEYPQHLESYGLADIAYQIDEGDWSGVIKTVKFAEPLHGIPAVRAIVKQGSDPEFFGMDNKGNSIEEEEF